MARRSVGDDPHTQRPALFLHHQAYRPPHAGIAARLGRKNLAVGCTVENQAMADYRLPLLLDAPLRHKLVICAPLLGPLDIARYLVPGIEEVSVGGESGNEARPCNYDWVLSIRRQCVAADIPFVFHQTGARLVKDGRLYRIRRPYQHSQARKAGIDYKAKR